MHVKNIEFEQDNAKPEGEGDQKLDQPEGEARNQAEPFPSGPQLEGEGEDEFQQFEQVEEIEYDDEDEPDKEILAEFPYDPSKKMSYEDFLSFYEDEIEGRLDRRKFIREQENMNLVEEDEEKESQEHHDENKKVEEEGEGADEGEGKDEAKDKKEEINKK